MKSYTDLEQSKKLAEILPIDSADMFYNEEQDETYSKDIVDTKYPMVIREGQKCYLEEYGIPCWSLAALLSVLPRGVNISTPKPTNELGYCCWNQYDEIYASNPVDACYEMILKLNEEKLL